MYRQMEDQSMEKFHLDRISILLWTRVHLNETEKFEKNAHYNVRVQVESQV